MEKAVGEICARCTSWVGSQNHQGRVDGVSQVNEEHRFGSHLHLLAGLGATLKKKQWYLHCTSILERAAQIPDPPILFLKLVNSVSECSWCFSNCCPCAGAQSK